MKNPHHLPKRIHILNNSLFHCTKIIFVSILFITNFAHSQLTYSPWEKLSLPKDVAAKGIIPRQLAVNPFGDIYLLDNENYWLVFIPNNSENIRIAGGWGVNGELFDLPTDIFTSSGLDVYLCDNSTHRILRFDKKLNFIGALALNELFPDPIEYPYYIADNNLGELLITNSGTWEINLLSIDGQSLTILGDVTYGRNRFMEISDMTVNPQNKTGVVDIGKKSFIELTRSGIITKKVPLPGEGKYLVQWWNDSWLLINEGGTLYRLKPNSNRMERIYPTGSDRKDLNILDFDVVGNLIYVVDEHTDTIYTSLIQ